MPKKTIDHARALASARGDAIATLLFGVALILASVIVALAEAALLRYLIGFGTFLAGVALIAWEAWNWTASPRLGATADRSSASPSADNNAARFPNGNATLSSPHFSLRTAPTHANQTIRKDHGFTRRSAGGST